MTITYEPVVIERTIDLRDYGPITDPENVEKYVHDYFADIPILANIARCESHFRHVNKDGVVLRGRKDRDDIGVMQINRRYHADTAEKLELDIFRLEDNVAYARYLYEKQGAKPWMSSSACWAKFSQSEIAKR